jgi:hypothetical protein
MGRSGCSASPEYAPSVLIAPIDLVKEQNIGMPGARQGTELEIPVAALDCELVEARRCVAGDGGVRAAAGAAIPPRWPEFCCVHQCFPRREVRSLNECPYLRQPVRAHRQLELREFGKNAFTLQSTGGF